LCKADRDLVMAHPEDGAKILQPIALMEDIIPMVRLHHENWDGSGYPDGRHGEETPLEARIVKIADYFDAITSIRPYRTPLSHPEACDVMRSERGRLLDPQLVDAFVGLAATGVLSRPAMSGVLPAVPHISRRFAESH
jgi:HD-GYP domain-containing protein (c-di-GMP phosphodiesterase class II)